MGAAFLFLNAFLNAKTSIKKFQFEVNKCHHIHIGKNKIKCPDLFINEWKLKKIDELETGFDNFEDTLGDEASMVKVEHDKYLGDIIAADGTNDRNIKARKDIANGIIRQIMSCMLHTVLWVCSSLFVYHIRSKHTQSIGITNIIRWLVQRLP